MSKELDSTKYPAGYYKNKKAGHKVVYLKYNKPNLATIYWIDTEDYYNNLAGFPVPVQGYGMSSEGQEIIIMGIKNSTIVPVKN